jgi:TusA-related sulfurtransferase
MIENYDIISPLNPKYQLSSDVLSNEEELYNRKDNLIKIKLLVGNQNIEITGLKEKSRGEILKIISKSNDSLNNIQELMFESKDGNVDIYNSDKKIKGLSLSDLLKMIDMAEISKSENCGNIIDDEFINLNSSVNNELGENVNINNNENCDIIIDNKSINLNSAVNNKLREEEYVHNNKNNFYHDLWDEEEISIWGCKTFFCFDGSDVELSLSQAVKTISEICDADEEMIKYTLINSETNDLNIIINKLILCDIGSRTAQ